MRTSVDLSDTQLQALNELSRKEERSRAALICQAIDVYLAKQRDEQEGVALGLWGKRKVDGVSGKSAERMVEALFDANILLECRFSADDPAVWMLYEL
jgi:Ribbon-helix-helix protein, copG family